MPSGLEVAGAVGVVPAGGDDGGEDAVVGLGERREAVAVEALEGRARRAQHEQVLDAGGVAHAARVGAHLLDAGAPRRRAARRAGRRREAAARGARGGARARRSRSGAPRKCSTSAAPKSGSESSGRSAASA